MSTARPNPGVPPVRDLRFSVDEIPKYWYDGDPAVTAMFNALSLSFPGGERFFIRSVRHFSDQVTDPELQEEVKGFGGQEAMHSREHTRFNEAMTAMWGPIIAWWANFSDKSLKWVEKHTTPFYCLAITCALEHWTAMLAEVLLSNPKVLQNVHPKAAEIWHWHAQEEIEHKAVAFDVYQAAGGPYWLRALVMISETILFLLATLFVTGSILRHNNQPVVRGVLRCVWFATFGPIQGWRLVGRWAAYLLPGFHPWQHDNRHLLQSAA